MIEKLPYLDPSIDSNKRFGDAYRYEPLLEYMIPLADYFCPSASDSCDMVECEDGKLREGKQIISREPSIHPNLFGNRFGEGKITTFREEEYLNDKTLQDMLKNFSIDKDKFWYLCLYLKDYSQDKTIESSNTPKEDLYDVLDEILENLIFTMPFEPSKEVADILYNKKFHPYYEKGKDGTLKRIEPEEYKEATKKQSEERKAWKPEYRKLTSYPKEELTQENISYVLEYLLNGFNLWERTWYFDKSPKLSLKMGSCHSLEVTNPSAILALAYALNKVKEELPKFYSQNINRGFGEDIGQLAESYKLFQFKKFLEWFLEDKESLGIPNVSTSKLLLISKMVYYTGLSDKEDYKKDYILNTKGKYVTNTILKDAIKKVNEKKLKKMRNNIYWL